MNMMRYYKMKMYGGRSLLARLIDFVFVRMLLLFVLFIVFLYLSRSIKAAILISVFLTAAFSLILTLVKRKRVIKYMEKDMERIRRKCLLEQLTLMKTCDFAVYIDRLLGGGLCDITYNDDGFAAKHQNNAIYVFQNHPKNPCGVSEVLRALRMSGDTQSVVVISLSEYTTDAKTFANSVPEKMALIPGEKVLQIAKEKDMLPDEQAAKENAQNEMKASFVTLDKVKNAAFGRAKTKGYILCGLIVMIWPLVSGFQFYYPIISIVCFLMAFFSYRKSKQAKEETADIGIS